MLNQPHITPFLLVWATVAAAAAVVLGLLWGDAWSGQKKRLRCCWTTAPTYSFRNKRVEFKIHFVCFVVSLFSATMLVGVWNMYDCGAGFGLVSFGGGPVGLSMSVSR